MVWDADRHFKQVHPVLSQCKTLTPITRNSLKSQLTRSGQTVSECRMTGKRNPKEGPSGSSNLATHDVIHKSWRVPGNSGEMFQLSTKAYAGQRIVQMPDSRQMGSRETGCGHQDCCDTFPWDCPPSEENADQRQTSGLG